MDQKQYDYKLAEKEIQQFWQENNIYNCQNENKLFSIDTPPPTVSGSLHVGHVFSYTQADIIARYKRLSGFSVFYPFGFDDNGLPTERFVEQKHNLAAADIKRSEFIEICYKESKLMAREFAQNFLSLGISADFKNTYSTISKEVRAISQRSFLELYKKGYIYRKSDPALYCTHCQTTVAQAELDDGQKETIFYTIIFKTVSGKNLLVATTRPELLPSCVALVCHPDDQRYKEFVGKKIKVPLYDYEVALYTDNHVDQEKGTGLVMICTFGDKTDILWYRKFSLTYRPSIDKDGRFLKETKELAGLTVFSARKKIIELLTKEELVTDQKPSTHSVSLHERCKKEIEFLIISQWFVDILSHKEEFLKAADQITWNPEFMKSRYIDWVKNLSWDWCISRQRVYGIPFPVFHCADCAAILLPGQKVKLPIDPQETKFVENCTKCGSKNLIPDNDVMDTWNTSSLTPYICKELLETKLNKTLTNCLPMSMRPQAHDIIRTWAFDTIVKTLFHEEKIPWKDIVISGHVLSKEKKKLSKKEGAALVPEILLQQFPADAIRYWTSCARLGYDVVYNDAELKNGVRLITKLWNAFRFIETFITEKKLEYTPQDTINAWIFDVFSKMMVEYNRYFNEYEFSLALAAIEQFFWQQFCDNYVEFIKHRLYNESHYSPQLIQETKQTLSEIGFRILQCFAPFVPHITEKLYHQMFKKHQEPISLHVTNLQNYQLRFCGEIIEQKIVLLLEIVKEVRKLKTERQLSLKTVIARLELCTDDHKVAIIREHQDFLKNFLYINDINFKKESAESGISEENGSWIIKIKM